MSAVNTQKKRIETLSSFIVQYKHNDTASYTHVCSNGNLKGKY